MNMFLQRFSEKIKGCINGFDRIVFKGSIQRLMYTAGATMFFNSIGVLNKDYKSWVMTQSKQIIDGAEKYAHSKCGCGIQPIPSSKERKESLAHKRQQELGLEHGLIGAWSCVEACSTYRAHYDATAGYPQLRFGYSRCKHLYFYYDHADFGFMSIRLQTWFPYGIQIALNGREWLRRSLEKEGIEFVVHGNKFLHIGDYKRAQELLNTQIDTRWVKLLDDFLPQIFPSMEKILGSELSYYWTLWQSEWATDHIFSDPSILRQLIDRLLRHALMTGTCERVLRYMGRPVDVNGQPHPRANPEVISRANVWYEGTRVRHWVDKNSVKMYNEHNVLRTEMTMNNPGMFRVYRHPQTQSSSGSKRRMPLRKGIADIAVRTQVASDINQRFMDQMATLNDDSPVQDVLKDITRSYKLKGRPVRALDITGKDRELLLALADPKYNVSGITNKFLQKTLKNTTWAKNGSTKQLSARISRHLCLLRHHGLIRKLPNQRKYMLTTKGKKLTSALNALLAASIQQLMEIAA